MNERQRTNPDTSPPEPHAGSVDGEERRDVGPADGDAETDVAEPRPESQTERAAPPSDTETDAPEAEEQDTVDLDHLADADPRTRAELLGALLVAEADRDEYLDDLRRARAEFENYRRRVTRESAQQRRAGAAEAVAKLLDVLDDLDRTVEAADASTDENLAKGVEMVATKLIDALRSVGVERIDQVGEPFDPTRHEAVQQVEAETEDGPPVVAEVLRPGYRLDNRVLRPAMVVVEG